MDNSKQDAERLLSLVRKYPYSEKFLVDYISAELRLAFVRGQLAQAQKYNDEYSNGR